MFRTDLNRSKEELRRNHENLEEAATEGIESQSPPALGVGNNKKGFVNKQKTLVKQDHAVKDLGEIDIVDPDTGMVVRASIVIPMQQPANMNGTPQPQIAPAPAAAPMQEVSIANLGSGYNSSAFAGSAVGNTSAGQQT